jgi:hypothetical protein
MHVMVVRLERWTKYGYTYKVKNTSAKSTELSNYSASLDIQETHDEVVACECKQTIVSLEGHRDYGGGYDDSVL